MRSYDRTAADILVRFRVHRTCALVTLLCGPHWLPRIGPHAYDVCWPIPPSRVPQCVGESEHAEHDGSLPEDFNTNDGDDPMQLPARADGAWDLLNDDQVLAIAVSAHYEASSLEYDHLSAAFLGYVALNELGPDSLALCARTDTSKPDTAPASTLKRFTPYHPRRAAPIRDQCASLT